MFSSLFLSHTISAVQSALSAAGAKDGGKPVVVVGPPRVGRGLRERGYDIVQVSEQPSSRRRALGKLSSAGADWLVSGSGSGAGSALSSGSGSGLGLALADSAAVALIGFGVGRRDDWEALIGEWSRVTEDGGALVMVDRGEPAELTRRALCSGLAEIEQRHAGRTIITSGLVVKL